ncbi:MAG: type II toxin-antitoxin system VapC family toxin [Kutzneria sp.]|nr:type II toxin-antitoxin system VapC family toxin [Kutzneria sp.]MBV9846349.1 type II toxin-antitoxin system VapC family toxin [Kutzneria sp.]
MIYLDSCAVIKLLVPEPESAALGMWLSQAAEPLVSSELLQVEVHRTLIRLGAAEQLHAITDELLASITALPLARVLASASRLPNPSLRSLDALHLATALSIKSTRFVTYDERLAAAATEAGLAVVGPS